VAVVQMFLDRTGVEGAQQAILQKLVDRAWPIPLVIPDPKGAV